MNLHFVAHTILRRKAVCMDVANYFQCEQVVFLFQETLFHMIMLTSRTGQARGASGTSHGERGFPNSRQTHTVESSSWW